jgi:hypothetical protein
MKSIQSREKDVALQVNVDVKIFLELSHHGKDDARPAQRRIRNYG